MESHRKAGQHSPGRLRTRLLGAMLLASLSFGAAAAEYPEKPLRAIVPFTPGGPNDIPARVISPLLAKGLGQNVIVENRPGADGRIGITALARAAPDGCTMLFSGSAVAIIPAPRKRVT